MAPDTDAGVDVDADTLERLIRAITTNTAIA